MSFNFGIDHLLHTEALLSPLKNSKCALVAHPASITSEYKHSLDALIEKGCNIQKAFGPQHGMRGDKQDNMIESQDYLDQKHQIPVISLYGEHRRPTDEMLENIDIVLFDLQDLGCRIYTYITTLLYFLEACDKNGIELWVLDRPNPSGRPVDGTTLIQGEESFVGCARLPIRHGLTVGELANCFISQKKLNTKLKVVSMQEYQPLSSNGYGWPNNIPWVNPSPNANTLNMARCFGGTVLLEGTNLSEGRGTTTPLEVIGAPNLPVEELLAYLQKEAPDWIKGVYLRPCYFEPTFHKFKNEMCAGIQIHTDIKQYQHEAFKPYKLIAGLLKALRHLQPEFNLWRNHDYEYELDRLPIDVINGGPSLRLWVDDANSQFSDMEKQLLKDEKSWLNERDTYLLYR